MTAELLPWAPGLAGQLSGRSPERASLQPRPGRRLCQARGLNPVASEIFLCVRRPGGATGGFRQPRSLRQLHMPGVWVPLGSAPVGGTCDLPKQSFQMDRQEGIQELPINLQLGDTIQIMALMPQWPRQAGTAQKATILHAAAQVGPMLRLETTPQSPVTKQVQETGCSFEITSAGTGDDF